MSGTTAAHFVSERLRRLMEIRYQLAILEQESESHDAPECGLQAEGRCE